MLTTITLKHFGIGGLPSTVIGQISTYTKFKIRKKMIDLIRTERRTQDGISKILLDIDIFIVYSMASGIPSNFTLFYFNNINNKQSMLSNGYIVCSSFRKIEI